jgi:hypothetical protein
VRPTPTKVQRTDRFGFIIPEGYTQPGSNSRITSRPGGGGGSGSASGSASGGDHSLGDHEPHTPKSEPPVCGGAGGGGASTTEGESTDGTTSVPLDPSERPYDGPPPSSPFGGVIHRHTLPEVPLTDRERKAQRAHLLLENLRIKKWMDMFANWEEYVCCPRLGGVCVCRVCVL